MKKHNIALIVLVFIIVLSGARVGWLIYHQPLDGPEATNGSIDFSQETFNDHDLYTLDGEWEFYPDEFVPPNSINNSTTSTIQVPEDWRTTLNSNDSSSPFGYGTYHLKIHLPDEDGSSYGIRFMGMGAAAEVYVNGELVKRFNHLTTTDDENATHTGPFIAPFDTEKNEADVTVHVSNFNNPRYGGLSSTVKFGTEAAVRKETQASLTTQTVVSIIYLLHALYAFIIFFLAKGRFQKELLFYGLMLILSGATILIDDEVVLQLPFQIKTTIGIKLFALNSTLLMMLLFIRRLFQVKNKAFYVLVGQYLLLLLVQLTLPYEYYSYLTLLVLVYYISAIWFMFTQTFKAIQHGAADSILVLLFVTSYSSNTLWGIGIKAGTIEIPYYPFDFIVSIILIALFLFRRHIKVMDLNLKQTEQLKEADRQKDAFLANTSHELRTPLHGIVNIAHIIKDDQNNQLTIDHQNDLETLIQIAQRMTFTLNDLLDATRLDDQGIKLQRTPIKLYAVAAAVIDMTRTFSHQKSIKFDLKIDPSFPALYADKNRVIQILFNLLHNGIKFTRQGTITIEAEHDSTNTMALIHVSDTGMGIKKEHLKSIFQPYEQENRGTVFHEGVGLGLSISRQLVELQGGSIQVTSEVDKGTTFTFSLPLAHGSAAASHSTEAVTDDGGLIPDSGHSLVKQDIAAASSNTQTEQPKVLIVDDDPVNLKVLQSMLTQEYDVNAFLNPIDALEFIRMNDLDLVIADVMMPEMSGYEFTQAVRETYSVSELPIILLTARQQQEDIYTGFMSGANDYVTKPVSIIELKARVGALTALKHSVREQLRTEAAWLQAQIQPHFLLNTLNTIAALSEIDTTRMIKLLEAFGNYLRKSFNVYNTEDLVDFETEIELIQSYLYIEKERFGDRIQVEWEIEQHDQIHIPPLSMQPLIENAIRHGILKKQKGGTIWIRLLNQPDHWIVEIEDDGIGMEEEEIERLLQKHPQYAGSIGFANTNKRLKQKFGSGLVINSQKKQGTKVQFTVPK